MVGVVDYDIDAAQADNLMELVASFVDIAVFRHEGANFGSFFLHGLRELSAEGAQRCRGQVWFNLLGDV